VVNMKSVFFLPCEDSRQIQLYLVFGEKQERLPQ
jgi:hypothetical protein